MLHRPSQLWQLPHLVLSIFIAEKVDVIGGVIVEENEYVEEIWERIREVFGLRLRRMGKISRSTLCCVRGCRLRFEYNGTGIK